MTTSTTTFSIDDVLTEEAKEQVLEKIQDRLLDVFCGNCFRDELKYYFENYDDKIQTKDGEEEEIRYLFDHRDFEAIIDLKLRFS